MHLLTLASKNLGRRPARSILTAAGLGIAIAALVALVGVAECLESSFLELYTRQGVDLVVQRKGGAVQIAKGIELKLGNQIRVLPNVKQVIAGLMDMIAFEDHNLFAVLVNGWELNSPVLDRVQTLTGRRLQAGDEKSVMLGRILAANLNKQVGDSVRIYGRDFRVVGIFESFSVYENGAVFMSLEELQKEMDRPGHVTGFVVEARNKSAAAVAELRGQIEALNRSVAVSASADFVSSLSQMKLTRTMSWVTALIAIAIGTVGVLNTMAMSVFERRGEIAAFRAMGWRKGRVMRLILTEAVCLSLVGALLGIAFGIAAIKFLASWKMTSGLVQGDISLIAIGEGIIVAAAMAVLGASIPAYRSASRPIADSLRGA